MDPADRRSKIVCETEKSTGEITESIKKQMLEVETRLLAGIFQRMRFGN